VSTSRLEAFSDGVIAIAITLLVLDIKVPAAGHGSLGHELAHQWPNYVAYVVSFLTIGIIWMNHHVSIGRLRIADHTVMVLNLLLLLTIGVLPFTTSLLAAYLRDAQGEHLAAAVYAGSFLALGLMFYALNRYVLSPGKAGLRHEISEADCRRIRRRNAAGVVPYALAVALAPVSAYASLGVCALVAAYYAIPPR
jgi:uncharacterized membrane protein